MSKTTFRSKHGEAHISGAENAHCWGFVRDLTMIAIDEGGYRNEAHPIAQFVEGGPSYATDPRAKGEQMELAVGVGVTHTELRFLFDGQIHRSNDVALNTALALANDVVRMAVRIACQAEIHGYVEGPNRAWLADLMRKGRATHVLRPLEGWEDVIALLESRDDEPVVTSYSVTPSFPETTDYERGHRLREDRWYDMVRERSPVVLPDPEEDPDVWSEAFYDLFSEDERWDLCIAHLREGGYGKGLEWAPGEDWDNAYFGYGVSYLEMMNEAWRRRFDKSPTLPS